MTGTTTSQLSYGVSGFRVDAIGEPDLAAIEAKLNRTVDGTRPYMALEVPPGGPGELAPPAFEGEGGLLGFDFASQIESAFKSYTTPPGGNITDLQVFGEAAGLLPSGKELAFVENHDTERNGSTLSYKDGATNTIATEFMFAEGYGTPQVYASFAWANPDDSPARSGAELLELWNFGRRSSTGLPVRAFYSIPHRFGEHLVLVSRTGSGSGSRAL